MNKRHSASQYFQEDDGDVEYSSNNRGGPRGGPRSSTSGPPPGGVGLGSSSTPSRSADFQEPNDYQDETEVAEMLTKATVTNNERMKLESLRRVQEIILHKQPALLDNFLDEMLNFHTESNPDVQIFILEFIAESCKVDPESIPKVLPTVEAMLNDPFVTVQKIAIHVLGKVYVACLTWLCRSKNVTEEMEGVWSYISNNLKRQVLRLIDNDNDAIRTFTVVFMERIILLQTPTESDSILRKDEFCLDDVPITVKVARPRKLEEDARALFDELINFLCSRHASSVNLMTSMGAVILIAKLRPQFMGAVIAAMEKLIAILPPTLERTQVESVKKHMKMQLIGLLRHPRAIEYFDSITTLLTDLGTTNQELHKSVPNWDEIRYERRKRQRVIAAEKEEEASRIKRARMDIEPVVSTVLEEESDEDEDNKMKEEDKASQTDDEKIFKHLNKLENAVDIVISSMDNLPDLMPNHFMATFTPIAIAGTEGQIKHVARLLAAQISSNKDQQNENVEENTSQIPTLVSQPGAILKKPETQVPQMKKKMIYMKLGEMIRPLTRDGREKFTNGALRRLLSSQEKFSELKCKIIASIGANSSHLTREYLMVFISEDIRERLDMGIHWIFAEYNLSQGFMPKTPHLNDSSETERYEWAFQSIMKSIMKTTNEAEKSSMVRRLFTEAPLIPNAGLDLLKELCGQPHQSAKTVQLLMESAIRRPMPKKLHYLSVLLEFTSHISEEVRSHSVKAVIHLYETGDTGMKAIFEDQAIHTFLNSMSRNPPPDILFTRELGRLTKIPQWNEELVKASIHLFLELLSIKNSLIHELSRVYVETDAIVKRGILRLIEKPIRKMGMDSKELMKLLDTFPKGAETLITRIIHILTDKTLPSQELVSRVRNLYAKRVSDVRFLIPVLNGLNKNEIIAALPKLIKLNPVVVKEVFNRLLGTHADAKTQHVSPISPADLLIALHNIEPSKCDVKFVIKATSICFSEGEIYSAEVLAIVINQLLEQNPLPTLLMRTVIQTLALHSKLTGFILNTLSRLIRCQVWSQPKIWEGFIKCCQRTIPKSIPILLTLPPQQLKEVLDSAPDLREPLVHHVMLFSQQQRSCMPPSLLSIVLGKDEGIHVKHEEEPYFEGEYDENGRPRSAGNHRPVGVKEEGSQDSITIKDEPMEYS